MGINKLPTGSEILNDFIEGGYDSDIITTIYGPPGSGKTTMCLLACIATAHANKKVIYIDTEGGFSVERMKQLTGPEFEKIMSQILILNPTNFQEQNSSLDKLKKIINKKIGLIIVDTLTIFYRLELAKSKNIKESNNKLIWQLSYLTEIARKQKFPIIITNQVYSDFSNRDQIKMVGGDILKYNSKCLIELKKLKGNARGAVLQIHRSIPEGKELKFAIINKGIISLN